MKPHDKLDILVIDDDELTAESVNRALKKTPLKYRIVSASDGKDGLDVLNGRIADRQVERPYIVLLDLNMPQMNGFEFLTHLREDSPDLRDSIVFVLTTSDSDSDRTRAYHEQIAGYMVKSCIGPQFSRLAALLNEYSNTVRLPA